jgi:anti-anti-sigma factor
VERSGVDDSTCDLSRPTGSVRKVTSPGTVEVPSQILPGDHACWIYATAGDLADTTVSFLSEGQRLGEHLLFVGGGTEAHLLDLLTGMADRDALLATGRLEVRSLFDVYARSGAINPVAQVEVLRRARDGAVAGGASGLRIAAEISGLVRGAPETQRGLHTYEREVCDLFHGPELTALCLYDAALGRSLIGPITLLHPVRRRVGEQLAVHLRSLGQGLALQGELDLVDAEDVLAALSGIAETTDSDMDLDLSELSFLDVAGARTLAVAASEFRKHGHQLRPVSARPAVRRCLDLFAFDRENR